MTCCGGRDRLYKGFPARVPKWRPTPGIIACATADSCWRRLRGGGGGRRCFGEYKQGLARIDDRDVMLLLMPALTDVMPGLQFPFPFPSPAPGLQFPFPEHSTGASVCISLIRSESSVVTCARFFPFMGAGEGKLLPVLVVLGRPL